MCIFSCFVRLIVPSKAMLERIQPYFFSFLLVFVCYLKKLRRLFSIIALSSWLRLLFYCRFLKYGIKYSFFLLLEYWISIFSHCVLIIVIVSQSFHFTTGYKYSAKCKILAIFILKILHFLVLSSALEEYLLLLMQNIGKFTWIDIMNYGKPV